MAVATSAAGQVSERVGQRVRCRQQKRIKLKALVAGEEREASVEFSNDGLYYAGQRENVNRKREEIALLQLANGAERATAK